MRHAGYKQYQQYKWCEKESDKDIYRGKIFEKTIGLLTAAKNVTQQPVYNLLQEII
jgi:hypothetical protein